MTRKQALSAAIETLNAAGQTEAAEILHKLSGELPFFSWSKEAIFDAVDQFILDHGRAPTTTDFKKRGLPPHTVIKRRFGVTVQEWLEQHYPTNKTPLDELQAKATEDFIKEYLRIRPTSAEDYNARRTHPSCGWFAIAKYNHTRRWRILLEKLDLPIYNNRDVPDGPPRLMVNFFSDYDFEE